MHDFVSPSLEELAAMEEAELEEWDWLAVRDYWESVIAEELDAPVSKAIAEPAEKARMERISRRSPRNVLRLVSVAGQGGSLAPSNCGEAA